MPVTPRFLPAYYDATLLTQSALSAGPGEITYQQQMLARVYAILGQTVTYAGTVDSGTIKMVTSGTDAEFPGGFDSQAADNDVAIRVMLSDIQAPRRGDTLTALDGTVYTVDAYMRQPNSPYEWQLRCTRG